jgi:anaerobic magnesium-protoporphyrin IX monomethyl ester cyclase
MRVLLLRPPRYVWPFNSETSAFWQPLGLLCLAAAVRRELPEVRVEVWDCPGEKCGWKSLERRLAAERIDVLGVGEETVSAHEALRAATLAKRLHPGCVVVAGGTYFAHAIEETLGGTGISDLKSEISNSRSQISDSRCHLPEPAGAGDGPVVDFIVRGEGEVTFVELLRALASGTSDLKSQISDSGCHLPETPLPPGLRVPASPCLRVCRSYASAALLAIPGLAFRGADGRIVRTPPRGLIGDLDALPFPAYDLIDMSLYGRGSRNHPALVSLEHSRGCVDSCGFCILWKQMGESADGNGHVVPRYRTKSPGRSFEEVERLYRQFGRRTFGWVDPTFNASPEWSDGWAERMLGSDLVDARGRPRTLHTAWLRADGVLRDEKLGILAKLVRAGLRQVMIGVERDDAAGLDSLGKHHNEAEASREAFAIFREKYPAVYTIGSIIFGLPSDTPADLLRLSRAEHTMGMDYSFLIPLTPNPGTQVAVEAARSGRLANRDLASYNFHTPVCTTETMDLRMLERIYWRLMLRPDGARIGRWLRQFVTERDARKRRVHLAMLGRGTRIALESLWRALAHRHDGQPALYSRRPPWYDQ